MLKVVHEFVSELANYRFRNNPEMLKLNISIRANAATCFAPEIPDADIAQLPALWGSSQKDEACNIVAKIQSIIQDSSNKIAILFRGSGKNAEIVEAELSDNSIPYFYGMFTDEDSDYVEFHNKCQEIFIKKFGKPKNINKKSLLAYTDGVKTTYTQSTVKTIDSLLGLLIHLF